MAIANVETLKMQVVVSGDYGDWDITEFILRGSVKKTLAQPPGQWELTCRPILKNGVAFDVGVLQIMDFIEIRVGRPKPGEPIPILTRGLVALIQISDAAAQNDTGEPQRSIRISGYDMSYAIIGKTLRSPAPDGAQGLSRTTIRRYQRLHALTTSASLIFHKIDGSGDMALIGLSKYISQIMKVLLNNEIIGFQRVNKIKFNIKTDFPKFAAKDADGDNMDLLGVVAQASILTFRGNLWSYLQQYVVKPLCEMFVEDNEDSVDFIFRWTPHRTLTNWSTTNMPIFLGPNVGKSGVAENQFPKRYDFLGSTGSVGAIGAGDPNGLWFSNYPQQIVLSINEILSIQVGRNGNDLYTYFLTQMQTWNKSPEQGGLLIPSVTQRWYSHGATPGDPHDYEAAKKKEEEEDAISGNIFENTSMNPWFNFDGIARHGLKAFVFSAPYYPATYVWKPPDPVEGVQVNALYDSMNAWIAQTMTGLENVYVGQIVVRGNPNIKIGQELFIDRNRSEIMPSYFHHIGDNTGSDPLEQYYVESVEHSWQVFPGPQFATSVGVTRGKYIKTTPITNTPFTKASSEQSTSFRKIYKTTSNTEPVGN